VTKDTTALKPDVVEYKVYAPDVRPVLVLGISGGGGREEPKMEKVDAQAAKAAATAPLGKKYE
jgi:hypothetical protein